MVVVDSSALIPLAWVGRLDLISHIFDEITTTEAVRAEVLTEGTRGTAALADFLDDADVHATPTNADEVASMEGIATTDASVLLLAADTGAILLANDKSLIEVARSHSVECWWVTTLLLSSTKTGIVSPAEATDILYDLVVDGMNLHPKVYARVHQDLRELGD